VSRVDCGSIHNGRSSGGVLQVSFDNVTNLHPVAWAYLARGVLNLIKPPATGQKPHFTAGGGAAWDGLPDFKHPVAWAYLARGVLYFIKPPPRRGKSPFYGGGDFNVDDFSKII
jgi:hypothetical protein